MTGSRENDRFNLVECWGVSCHAWCMVIMVWCKTLSINSEIHYPCRSILFFLACILSFVWPLHSSINNLQPHSMLGPQIAITTLVALGMLYFILIVKTFSQYGSNMDELWQEEVETSPSTPTPYLQVGTHSRFSSSSTWRPQQSQDNAEPEPPST